MATAAALTASDENSLRKTAAELKERGIRGVVLLRPHASVDEAPFVWDRLACVRISGNPTITRVHNVMSNTFHRMSVVIRELARRGYRRPGLVSPRRAAGPGRCGLLPPAC